jgi:hypothetical protein
VALGVLKLFLEDFCFVLVAVAEFANFLQCSQEKVAVWLGLKKPIYFLKIGQLGSAPVFRSR